MKGLKIGHYNIRSQKRKFSQMSDLVALFDIMCISESWLLDGFPDHKFYVSGYQFFRLDRIVDNREHHWLPTSWTGTHVCCLQARTNKCCSLLTPHHQELFPPKKLPARQSMLFNEVNMIVNEALTKGAEGELEIKEGHWNTNKGNRNLRRRVKTIEKLQAESKN